MRKIIGKILQVIGFIVVIMACGILLGIVAGKIISPLIDKTTTDVQGEAHPDFESEDDTGMSDDDSAVELPNDESLDEEANNFEVVNTIANIRSNYTLFNIFYTEIFEDWIDHQSYYDDPYEWLARFVSIYDFVSESLAPTVDYVNEKIESGLPIPSNFVAAHNIYEEVVSWIYEAMTVMYDALNDEDIVALEDGFDNLLAVLAASRIALDLASEAFLAR